MALRNIDPNNPLPKYHQLKMIIEDGILLGDLCPGEKLFSERQMCKMFGISRPMVTKSLNELTETGLLLKKRGSGTYISTNARNILQTRRQRPSKNLQIGIGFLDLQRREDPKTIKILNAVQGICDRFGVSNRLLGTPAHVEKENLNEDIDGVLVIDETYAGEVYSLEERKIPFVTLLAKYEGKDYPVVMNDPVKIGNRSAEYFISKGHKRIAYITGPLVRPTGCCLAFSPQMIEGYRQALKCNDIRFSSRLIKNCNYYKESEAYNATIELLSLSKPPTAIIAFDDILAMGAIRAIQEKGLRIPGDLAILGYGDILDSDFLSTVNMNIIQVASAAFNMLMRLIHRQPIQRENVIVDFDLIIRKSSG